MALGKKIREALRQRGMTQKSLAQELGVTPTAVSHWIQGITQPNQSNIEKIEEILDVPLRIGNWVKRKRTERQMSVAELSEKSGVSMPTIYNIESGKIQIPQDKTVAKLATAFGDQVPEEVKETSAEVSSIEGLGAIQDFSPHERDRDEWPEVAGVYLLYDISDRLIYIGETENIKRRLSQHEQKFWFKSPIVERSSYIEISDKDLRRQVEAILIKSLRSHAVLNYQGVRR